MSLVVAQTLPYTREQLQLEDPSRWSRLFPLMRPSMKAIESSNGRRVILNTSLLRNENVLVAAVSSAGNLASKLLTDSRLAAFTTEQPEQSATTAEELVQTLKSNGYSASSGVVILRAGGKDEIRAVDGLIELDLESELKLDHVLSLLNTTKPEIKASFEKTRTLLEHFVKSAAHTTSIFHEEKIGGKPSLKRSTETAEFSTAKEAIEKDLDHILKSAPGLGADSVYSIHYSDINGLSRLETNILAHEISAYLASKSRESYISHSAILNSRSPACGWSISFCAVPTAFLSPQDKPSNTLASTSSSIPTTKNNSRSSTLKFNDAQVRNIITAGCKSVMEAEPTITEYDTIVGDGDCGFTLRDGANQVLKYIANADLAALPSTLSDLVDDLEVNMGGTSGALYCIFLSSLAQNLWDAKTFPDALQGALEQLLRYTKARLGDRTCLDCLIPFVETLRQSGNANEALSEAEKGVRGTEKMEATLGRSSYLDESATRGVPDPGAYGLLKLLEGMVNP